jgi:hypothetical protein
MCAYLWYYSLRSIKKLTRLIYKIAIQLHLEAESCTIYSFRSRRSVRELLDTPSYITTFLSENLKGSDHADNLGVEGKIILEWILGE